MFIHYLMVHVNIVFFILILDGESRRFGGGYKLNNILCYDNWI